MPARTHAGILRFLILLLLLATACSPPAGTGRFGRAANAAAVAASATPLPSLPAAATPAPPAATPVATPVAQTMRFLRQKVSPGDQWPFVALFDPAFIPAGQANYLQPLDLVIGVSLNGESKAYPVSLMWFHHVANDTLGGVPVAITY